MALFKTQDGSDSVLSEKFGASYHSKFGAVTESEHVFINSGLRYIAAEQREISILEAGFGTGLNAFMTWLEAEKGGLQITYLALEKFPLDPEEAAGLNYPDALDCPGRRPDFLKLHEQDWDGETVLSPCFSFEKRRTDIGHFNSGPRFDLIYFDAFDPQVQAELWTAAVMKNMYESLRPSGVLLTYCAQGSFRRNLKNAGFQVEKLPGTLGKWENTRAFKTPNVSRVL